MKKLLFLFLLGCFLSCEKETMVPCQEGDYFFLHFRNTYGMVYELNIDGAIYDTSPTYDTIFNVSIHYKTMTVEKKIWIEEIENKQGGYWKNEKYNFTMRPNACSQINLW